VANPNLSPAETFNPRQYSGRAEKKRFGLCRACCLPTVKRMTDYSPALFLTVFLAVAVIFPFMPLALAGLWARYFSPAKPGPIKNATYECGLKSEGDAWIQFKSDYYLYAILFLIFDVEVLFLFPFAVAFLQLPAGAVVAMLIFVLLLVEGLAWAWAKGALNWK
jgi:NADH:ubiquinone oxidoreductase subunit 3 (subunit A)